MADFIFDKARQLFLEGSMPWLTGNIKLVLVDPTSYTPSQSADDFLAVIPIGMRVAISSNLASKTSTLGVANAAAVVLSSVSGAQCSMFVLYRDVSSDPAVSPVLTKQDSYAGLPVTPNGGNITIAFPSDSNKIFKL